MINQGRGQGSRSLTFSRDHFSWFGIFRAYLNVGIDTNLTSVKGAVIQERAGVVSINKGKGYSGKPRGDRSSLPAPPPAPH